jgi:hypothetical protein
MRIAAGNVDRIAFMGSTANALQLSPCPFKAGWQRVWRAVALLLLGTWTVSHLAAASEPLHHLIHGDCDSPQHTCLAGSMTHGLIDVAVTTVEPAPAPIRTRPVAMRVPVLASVPAVVQPPVRAPPAFRA